MTRWRRNLEKECLISPTQEITVNPHDIALFTGNAHPQLAHDIARILGLELGHAHVGRFNDGKPNIQMHEDVRDRDVYIIQPDGPPTDWFAELKELIKAARRSARRVTVIVSYFSSGRADRRDEPGKVITAAKDAREYAATNVDRVVLFDLHAGQIVGMIEAAGAEHVDELYYRPVMLDRLSMIPSNELANSIVSPPDVGRLKVVRSIWKRLRQMGHHVALGVVDKDGSSSTGIQDMTILGDFEGKHVHLFDDIYGTGSTGMMATRGVLDRGAIDVTYWATHMVLPDRSLMAERLAACARLAQSPIKRIIVSDSLPIGPEERAAIGDKLEVLSIAPLFALIIKRLHEPRVGHRLSSLFELEGYRAGLRELEPST